MKKLTFTLTFLLICTYILQAQAPYQASQKALQYPLDGQRASAVLLGLSTHQLQDGMKKVVLPPKRINRRDLPANYTIVYSASETLAGNRKYRINGNEIYEFYEGRPVSDLWADDTGYVYGYKSVTEREFFYSARNERVFPEDMEYVKFAYMELDDKHILLQNENNPIVGQVDYMVNTVKPLLEEATETTEELVKQ